MKRRQLLRLLRENHCVPDEKGRASTLYRNVLTGAVATVPNDPEPDDLLIVKLCRALDVPVPQSLNGRPRSAPVRQRLKTRTPRG